ncbi:2-methoxy-6-polyprenyl-1,4-benzoquinol methylase [Ranunculus cassubicifolius]
MIHCRAIHPILPLKGHGFSNKHENIKDQAPLHLIKNMPSPFSRHKLWFQRSTRRRKKQISRQRLQFRSFKLMNDLMSGGLHRLWKDRLVSDLNPFPGMKHLDVAGGTGDVAFRILDRVNRINTRALRTDPTNALNEETQIHVCDINDSLKWVEGDAEKLGFEDNSMDGYTIAFGIRNVTHIEKALAEAYRVLKRGGRFLCLELSHVDIPVFKDFYDYYSFSVIPAVGEMVTGDRESYQYLVENAGFQKVQYENLVGGVVAIHSGLKI